MAHAEGQYDCPVTGKVFTEHTHIVALRTSGNVYAYESVSWSTIHGAEQPYSKGVRERHSVRRHCEGL